MTKTTKKTTKKTPVKKKLAEAVEKVTAKAKPKSDEIFDLMDFCQSGEIIEEIIEHDGKNMLFRVREFMASDREGLLEFMTKISDLAAEFQQMKDEYADEVVKCQEQGIEPPKFMGAKSIVKERYWMNKYKAKLAFQLLVDKNGAPLFRSFESMQLVMKPELLDKVGEAVHKVVNMGGVSQAEKP